MAIKTFYVLNTLAVTPNWFCQLQDGGTAPTNVACTFGWAMGTNPVSSPYWRGRIGASLVSNIANGNNSATSWIDSASGPTAGTGNTNATAGDSFITPAKYTGTFANTAWTFNFYIRCANVNGNPQSCARFRVWASANADGTSARQLSTGTLIGSTVAPVLTTVEYNSTLSWSPGAITLNDEYLFFQIEWQSIVAGTNASNNAVFRQGPSSIITPDLGAGAPAGKLAKVWDGSAWVTKPVKVWSSSAWVTKPIKVWNGSAWV